MDMLDNAMLANIKKLLWVLAFSLWIFGLYGFFMMNKTLWPGIHQDGMLFSTVVINQANGFGNKYNVNDFQTDTSHNGNKFSGHGQLYYPFAASFMRGNDYPAFLRFLYTINLLTYVCSSLGFLLFSQRVFQFNYLKCIWFSLIATYSVSGLLLYLQGRPEHGIPIVLTFFILIREVFFKNSLPAWLSGAEIGIVASFSPLPGALFAIYRVFSRSLDESNLPKLFFWIIATAISAICVWFGLNVLIYDDSVIDLIQNILASTKAYNKIGSILPPFPLFNLDWFNYSWFRREYCPGIGMVFLLNLILAMYAVFLKLKSSYCWISKLIPSSCLMITSFLIWHNGFSHSPINYTFLCFYPLMLLWFIEKSSNVLPCLFRRFLRRNTDGISLYLLNKSDKIVMEVIFITACALSFLPALGYARVVSVQEQILRSGISYEDTLLRVQNLKNNLKENEVILIDLYSPSRSAVVFDSPPWRFQAFEEPIDKNLEVVEKKNGVFAKYRLYIQEVGVDLPRKTDFFPIEVRFNKTPASLLGIPLFTTTPGYGFAIYERSKIKNEK